ncbi:zinc-binding dehydrogenase [Trinickia sp. LjRoot230]|uniref:quinone oxidoreductase family protein n=1 Tax=Trinickia sp. LjRoot230 TaxID=3342288 RepID=UPI003ECDC012
MLTIFSEKSTQYHGSHDLFDQFEEHDVKAVMFDKVGPPAEVLYLGETPVPTMGENDVLVRLIASSINPGDLLFIQNLYPEPKRPRLPQQIAGNHGAGLVERVGSKVNIARGTFVAFSHYNTWAEYAVVPSQWLIPIPDNYRPEKAGQLMNPITAWDLLDAAQVLPGQWLALTAGYSSISTMTLQFARQRGVNVIPIVRRTRNEIDLRLLGAAELIDLSDLGQPLGERIKILTNGHGLDAVIDNVGGPVTGELVRSLAFGGRVVINGGMSPERFELHNFDLLMSGAEMRASIYRYFFNPPKPADWEMLSSVIAAFGSDDFYIPRGATHRLDDFELAIRTATEHSEQGKQLFVMG